MGGRGAVGLLSSCKECQHSNSHPPPPLERKELHPGGIHWCEAPSSAGALLGLKGDFPLPPCQEDPEMPGLFHAGPTSSHLPLEEVVETYLLSKQGKSCRYQLWSYRQVQESNSQLTDFSPKRAGDGKVYVVPAGGLQEGLCGKAVLLRPLA